MSAPHMGPQAHNTTDFSLAPGEADVYGDRFIASIMAPYMKAQLMCSTTRFVYKAPNTLLGFIPLGFSENTMPLRNIASVTTNVKFSFGRFIWALILFILAIVLFNSGGAGAVFGILLLLWSIASFLTSFPVVLGVVSPAGMAAVIQVSTLEKGKMERFRAELQGRVFADQGQTRHDEAQQLRMQQVMLQQMHMQQNMMAGQGQPQMAPPPGQQAIPPVQPQPGLPPQGGMPQEMPNQGGMPQQGMPPQGPPGPVPPSGGQPLPPPGQ